MGYSCTAVASRVLDFILADLSKNVGNGTSNGWFNNAKELFFEQGRENADGAITGRVYEIRTQPNQNPNKLCYQKGSVRIEPSGTITRFYGIPISLRRLAMGKLKEGVFGSLYYQPNVIGMI